jgi:hypothetical protein
MATLNATTASLIDVTRTLGPDGKHMQIAEILTQTNEVLPEMAWKEGNLVTGDRHAQRATLPTTGWRRLNQGIARSKSTSRVVDEAAALLEANSQVDRKLAILSGDPAAYRLSEAAAFMESMNQEFTQTLFYGNANLADNEFTGFTPRYNSLSGPTGEQIIDAGGTGTDNRSIWLVAWGDPVTGIFPKNTVGGLNHMDTTANLRPGGDGYPIGDEILDANSNPYLGYKDHWEWNCGLAIKDLRYVVRAANIDVSLLINTAATGADLQDLLVQMVERIQGRTSQMAFYAPRRITTMLRRQLLNSKNAFLSLEEMGGRKVTSFDGIPFRRVDQLEVDEARVT